MSKRNTPFIITLSREATSTTTFTAKTAGWNAGDVVVIDAVAVSVDAHKPKTVHVGVTRGFNAIYLETLTLSLNEGYFCTKAPITIPSDYKVVVKCVSPTAGVRYTINIFGHIEEIVEK